MDVLTAKSRAKINLTLRICGRRADGFHELESIVAQIGLADDVTIEARADSAITLDCSDPAIPMDSTNLALRAALLLQSRVGAERGAHIKLTKRIPAGAGLGGGSSNAATTLALLNRLWNLAIDADELAEIGATLGSDVPLFLRDSPLNIMRGRGERLEPVAARLKAEVLLALPPVHSPTAAVYAAFSRAGRIFPRPDAAALVSESIDPEKPGGRIDPARLMTRAFNDLEPAAISVTPALGALAERLRRESGLPFCMSGSGSAYFCLLPASSGEADAHRARLAARFPDVQFVSSVVASPRT